jgi:hypothetical protein
MVISIRLGGIFLLLSTGVFLYEKINGQGNHWFLFGTWIDRLVVAYPFIISLVFILPLVIPVFFSKSLIYRIIAICAVPLFFYYIFIFKYLGD